MARILVAEDDAAQRAMLVTILELRGHTVVEAIDGREVLRHLEKKAFDVMLLDVMMPELSGYDVLDALSKRPDFTTPIVMITAQNQPAGIAREARTGALEHISSRTAWKTWNRRSTAFWRGHPRSGRNEPKRCAIVPRRSTR